MPLLEVRNLRTYYSMQYGEVKAVDGISFNIENGESLGFVGESGSGKTTVLRSIIKLFPSNGRIVGGEIIYKGRELSSMNREEIRHIRWKEISIIPQSAMNSLDPVYRIGDQIAEAIQAHRKMKKDELLDRVTKLFEMVGSERKRLRDYPHQLSGGMKQRVTIAIALALDPSLLVADEPTTALDVIVQDNIVKEIIRLQHSLNLSILYITHDISLVAEACDKIAVMYAGKLVEYAGKADFFKRAYHPYTLGLQNAFPSLRASKRLISIPGFPPDLTHPPVGCRFKERCPFFKSRCEEMEPEFVEVENSHFSACHFPDRADEFRQKSKEERTWSKRVS